MDQLRGYHEADLRLCFSLINAKASFLMMLTVQFMYHFLQIFQILPDMNKKFLISFLTYLGASRKNLSLRSDTNSTVQPQKTIRGLKFQIKEKEELYYLYM